MVTTKDIVFNTIGIGIIAIALTSIAVIIALKIQLDFIAYVFFGIIIAFFSSAFWMFLLKPYINKKAYELNYEY